ncbi:MAG: phosphatase PAP2 family protein [Candidatus Dormibacteraeota bacterium]|jgi:membrane-associated phospholipid phosphatase|nr:phosphatase PAP2 family protein [Candidatus Dormibacteraeota bacterium]
MDDPVVHAPGRSEKAGELAWRGDIERAGEAGQNGREAGLLSRPAWASLLFSRLVRWRPQARTLVLITVAYLALCSAVLILRRMDISPEYLFVLLLPIAVMSGRFWGFFKDWVPFVVLLLSWEAMRGIAPLLGMPVHNGALISERWLFADHLPTILLQNLLERGWLGQVIDYTAAIVYFCHFPVTLGVAVVLWLVDRDQFLRYAGTLLGMGFVAFLFCLMVPTAPPWYAANQGLITGMQHVLSYTLPSKLSAYSQLLNPNPVAALPSLHAAFAFLGYLAVSKVYPRASWIMLAWCLAVWLSVVYLGEHYVVDVVAGVGLAGASWALSRRFFAPRPAALRSASVNAG